MRLLHSIITIASVIFLTACGGGGGESSTPSGNTLYDVNVSGVVIDNYVKGAIVCIDTDKDNQCSDEDVQHQTTTDINGSFILNFKDTLQNPSYTVVAYSGQDYKTNEDFKYLVKNKTDNKASSGKVVLTSITTLVTDLVDTQSKTLDESKDIVVEFLGGSENNISKDQLSEDIVSLSEINGSKTLFQAGLKLFDIVGEFSSEMNASTSASVFSALVETISSETNITIKSTEINITVDGTTKNIAVENSAPTIISSNNINFYENSSDTIQLEAIDADDDNLTYTLTSTDKDFFNLDQNSGILSFKSVPNYEAGKIEYGITLEVSDGNLTDEQNITINLLNVNEAPVINTVSRSFSLNEDTNSSGALSSDVSDVDANTTLSYVIMQKVMSYRNPRTALPVGVSGFVSRMRHKAFNLL